MKVITVRYQTITKTGKIVTKDKGFQTVDGYQKWYDKATAEGVMHQVLAFSEVEV